LARVIPVKIDFHVNPCVYRNHFECNGDFSRIDRLPVPAICRGGSQLASISPLVWTEDFTQAQTTFKTALLTLTGVTTWLVGYSFRTILRQSSQRLSVNRRPRSGTEPHTRQAHPSAWQRVSQAASFFVSESSPFTACEYTPGLLAAHP
jgi:hypothetical protein